MKNLRNTINSYKPFNEQEEKDKAFLLKAMDLHSDLLFRTNPWMHFSSSCWIVNPDADKVLMIYHKIYNSWAWLGGHADGEENLLKVAQKELQEESGIRHARFLSDQPFSLEVLTVDGHIKKNEYISSHLHLNLTYLFEADEKESLILNQNETNGVLWIPVKEVENYVSEEWMMKNIYRKLLSKWGDFK